MSEYVVRGASAHKTVAPPPIEELDLKFTPSVELRPAGARDANRGFAPTELKIADDDVLEVRFTDGFRLCITGESFRQEILARQPGHRGMTEKSDWELPAQLAFDGGARGEGEWVVEWLKKFDITPLEAAKWGSGKLGEACGPMLCGAIDRRLCGSDGTRMVEVDLAAGGAINPVAMENRVVKLRAAQSLDKPLLVFLHGTLSSTQGSFGGLWAEKQKPKEREAAEGRLARLRQSYGQVLALEHFTLTESPIANARVLAEALPANAKLHLVSHSRGGLIGELLCRSQRSVGGKRVPFTDREIDILGSTQQAELKDLSKLLAAKQFRIERFVRVACPALGTTLASERLDRWLSMVTWLVEKFETSGAGAFAGLLWQFALGLVKSRTDPRKVPGLEAMMPDSPFIRLINWPRAEVEGDLSVIAGDAEGGRWWHKGALLVPDLFFDGDHDWVVNTGSMFGGAKRTRGQQETGHFVLHRRPSVTHFHYFANSESAQDLVERLTTDVPPKGFEPLAKAPIEAPARRDAESLPVLIVVPDLFGTELSVKGRRVWPDLERLAEGGLAELDIAATEVEVGNLLPEVYGDLVRFFAATHRVVTFPYDWRRSVHEAAERLRQLVNDQRKLLGDSADAPPIRFLAHGQGANVLRALIAGNEAEWDAVCRHPQARAVLLGPPFHGSYVVLQMLAGDESTVRKLKLLRGERMTRKTAGPKAPTDPAPAGDRNAALDRTVKPLAQFPGLLELLPHGTDAANWFEPQTWQDLKFEATPTKEMLKQAHDARQRLDKAPSHPQRVVCVVGQGEPTPCGVRPGSDRRPEFLASRRGDGRVLWQAVPPGFKRYFLPVEDEERPSRADSFRALLDLLQTGETRSLSDTEPSVARELGDFVMPDVAEPMFPTEASLVWSAVGVRRRQRKKRREVAPIRVSVTHGDLRYAQHPVAVGHYEGDTIVGPEAQLNEALENRMSDCQALGLYPGESGSCEVFFPEERQTHPPGAIIVGLGRAGELTPAGLESAFTRAILRYVFRIATWPDDRFGDRESARRASLSTLVIGAGIDSFSIRDSLEALLRGLAKARQKLADVPHVPVQFDAIEFLELWEERAIEATYALAEIEQSPEMCEQFVFDRKLRRQKGGLRRVRFQEAPGWWHRLQIVAGKKGRLKFTALTRRARAAERLLGIQPPAIRRLVSDAIQSSASRPEIGSTLFEMLIPAPFKEHAPRRDRLVLVLDRVSAAYPWELLRDRTADGHEPLAVGVGLLRQLKVREPPETHRTTTEHVACVIGVPHLEKGWSSLPAAREEAGDVAMRLKHHGFDVAECIEKMATQVFTTLYAREYRVLHLAGHGVHRLPPDSDRADAVSGMVLGHGNFLTPSLVRQMRAVPELVFINCCYLARMDAGESNGVGQNTMDRHEFAANIAAEFIRQGVKAVVAAGWAVDDRAAQTFAQTFYDSLLRGEMFGQAVLRARRETYRRHPYCNTWGAYQCYGDPAFRLLTKKLSPDAPAERAEESAPEAEFVSPSEVIVELQNLASQASVASLDRQRWLSRELDRLRERIPADWQEQADVAGQFGLTLAELGRFADAIEWLRRALSLDRGSLSLEVFERLADCRNRLAVELWQQSDDSAREEARKLADESATSLTKLTQLAGSPERYGLLAAAHKRQAMMLTGAARFQALWEMRTASGKGFELRKSQLGDRAESPEEWCRTRYPEYVGYTADALLHQLGQPTPTKLETIIGWCQETHARAAVLDAEHPSFWNSVWFGSCPLLEMLASKPSDETREKATTGFLRSLQLNPSPRDRNSLLQHLDFVEEILRDPPHQELFSQVAKIRRALQGDSA